MKDQDLCVLDCGCDCGRCDATMHVGANMKNFVHASTCATQAAPRRLPEEARRALGWTNDEDEDGDDVDDTDPLSALLAALNPPGVETVYIPAPPPWAPNYDELWNEDGTPKPVTVPIADFFALRDEAYELLGRLYDLGKKRDRKRVIEFRDKWFGVIG